MSHRFLAVFFVIITVTFLHAEGYRVPNDQIRNMVESPQLPSISYHKRSGRSVHLHYNYLPTIKDLARPVLKLGGLRFHPNTFAQQQKYYYYKLEFFNSNRQKIQISGFPEDVRILDYNWSYKGNYFFFTVEREKTIDLWAVDFRKNNARKLSSNLNCFFGSCFVRIPGEEEKIILHLRANSSRKHPVKDASQVKPIIQETEKKASKVRTYQDLVKDSFGENQFEFFASSILCILDLESGKREYLNKSGIYYPGSVSPDGRFLLCLEYMRPFSYSVPYYYYARKRNVIDLKTKEKKVVASYPVSDKIPIYGVYEGPRGMEWQPYKDNTLIYVEALDEGDPENEVPNRDRVMKLDPPFEKPVELLRTTHRCWGSDWLQDLPGQGLLVEYNWKKRWKTTHLIDLSKRDPFVKVVEDISTKDAYNSMGSIITTLNKKGKSVAVCRNNRIFASSKGATDKGYFPFLQTVDLGTLEKNRVFQCREKYYERYIRFVDKEFSRILIKSESSTEYPNYFEFDLKSGKKTQITFQKDPAPELSGVKKQLIKYEREDGIPLSGILYLPVGYKKGQKVPAYVHAYPLEYSDASTAGQVRGSQNTFAKLSYYSWLFFLTQGVAVFKDAQFPIVGDPKTMNDANLEQLKMNAEAAKKALADSGCIDTDRLGCVGHSYGAFMVANLLIHTDIFRTGIAQSGAYNRTLTPFGFQSERRTLWQARDTYIKVSPFMHADRLKKPILVIHGEVDNNSGTFPMQSDRLFAAIKGNGGKARYVKLPYESHGYSALESILHVLAERYEWTEKHLKGN